MQKVEIEDVLASIRRLVSDGSLPRTREDADRERFLLTSALRVSADAAGTQKSTHQPLALETFRRETMMHGVGSETSTDAPDSVDAADDAAKANSGYDEIATETGSFEEPERTHTAGDAVQMQTAQIAQQAGSRRETDQAAKQFTPLADAVPANLPPVAALSEPPKLVSESDSADVRGSGPFVLTAAYRCKEAPSVSVARSREGQAEVKVSSGLGAAIGALEAAIAGAPDQWEPDGKIGDDNAGTVVEPLIWHDNDESERVSTVRTVKAGRQIDPLKALVSDDTTNPVSDYADLDEDKLQKLVADLVRQELRGALGDRITRNVRKMVRREIQRALTLQNLD